MRGDVIDTSGSFAALTEIAAATDAAAVLAAAKAWERGEMNPSHFAVLFAALARRRGPFIEALEREASACQRAGHGASQVFRVEGDEMRTLFRRDLDAIIEEAGEP